METRWFKDENGRLWKVTKVGSNFKVEGSRKQGEKLHQIARSCARKLGITHTANSTPIEYVNEHIRIWNAIWSRGENHARS